MHPEKYLKENPFFVNYMSKIIFIYLPGTGKQVIRTCGVVRGLKANLMSIGKGANTLYQGKFTVMSVLKT